MRLVGWIIFAAVIAALFALLCCSVKLVFEYGEEIRLRISFLMFTFYKIPAEKLKTKRKDKKDKKAAKKAEKDIAETEEAAAKAENTANAEQNGAPAQERASGADTLSEEKPVGEKQQPSAEEKPDGEPEKKKISLSDVLEIVKLLYAGLGKPLKKLLKRARIYHFYLHILCGGEDAAKAAINFGKTNILVGNALGWLATVFTLKAPDDIHIDVDFYKEDTTAECSLTLKLSLLAALAFLFTGAGRSVCYLLKNPDAAAAVKALKK